MDNSLFIVKSSSIPNAGKGLFTKVDILKDTIVLYYTGKKLSYYSHKSHDYCYKMDDNICINGLKSKHISKYVNDNHNHSNKQLNLEWKIYSNKVDSNKVDSNKIAMVSTCDIPKDSEMFISYEYKYWS